MHVIAVKLLVGDRAKYFGLIFGVTFSTLLMTQQISIFIGILARTASVIYSISEPDLWVMDQRVRYIEEIEPLRDIELTRVRSVPGVDWALALYKGLATIRLLDGLTQQVQLLGVDDLSLIGACNNIVKGSNLVLRRPQSAMIDLNGYIFMWPGQELKTNKIIELNDNRMIIEAICDTNPTFYTFPILYVAYDKITSLLPPQRKMMSFILVKAKNGVDIQVLKKQITAYTSLQALTKNEFAAHSINYFLTRTGIPINFGITVLLGALIGAAITAQTFYIFIVENSKEFATMKAIGITNTQLFKMVLLQALIVGTVGYSLGIGFTALFFKVTSHLPALKGFILHWQVLVGTFIITSIIIFFSILISLRKVFNVDPGIVFRN